MNALLTVGHGTLAAEDLAALLRSAGVRLVVAEIHPAVYGPEGTRQLFDALSAQGFAYLPEGSRGAAVVFGRERT